MTSAAADASFVNERADVVVGSCGADLTPSVCWGMGCHMAADGSRLTVWVRRQQAAELLAHVRATGVLAATFTEPLTARSRQIKGGGVTVRDARQADAPILARHLDNMVREIGLVGYDEAFVRAAFGAPLRELVALELVPQARFDQTPGPQAGHPIDAAAHAPGAQPAGAGASIATPAPASTQAPAAVNIGAIREALEGAIPGVMTTCDSVGMPNVAFLSQAHYVDDAHIALSYQFFNKTRRNILAHPHGQLIVVDPRTGQMHRMRLRYLRTESEGALFERMRAHLEGIASHTGMTGVFRLLGSDIYRVNALEAVPGGVVPAPPPARNTLAGLRRAAEALSRCADFATLVDTALDSVVGEFGHHHAMLLMLDPAHQRLYTVGTRGYASSGVGSEVTVGDGVIGTCARSRTAIRITYLTQAYRYQMSIRDAMVDDGQGHALCTEIPYPGLSAPQSQLGVPLTAAGQLLGVLFVESAQAMSIGYDDEDALVALGAHLGACIEALRQVSDQVSDQASDQVSDSPAGGASDAAALTGQTTQTQTAASAAAPLRVRRFPGNDSIFLDDQYLIKGVAGAIFWRLVSQYAATGRTAFSNRELRVDPAIRLPEVADNLEARLILLRRRLAEQDMGVQLLKSGRGLLTLDVRRPVALSDAA